MIAELVDRQVTARLQLLNGDLEALVRRPAALYMKLLTTPFAASAMPAGFFNAKVSLSKLSSTQQKRHAVGAVEVDIDGPDTTDGIIYTTTRTTLRSTRSAIRRRVVRTTSTTARCPATSSPAM